MKNMSFQHRLILGVLILTAAVTVSLGWVGGHLSTDFMKGRFKDRMVFLAEYLALNSELGILIGNTEMLEELAGNLVKEKDVIKVVILDAESKELVSAGNEPVGNEFERLANPVMLSNQGEDYLFFQNDMEKRLGSVEIIYTTTGINELLHQLRSRFMLVAVFLSILGVTGFFVFSRSLTAPLETLVKTTVKVSEGDLDVRVPPGTLPETRKLSSAFNEMLVDLANSRRDLESTYQEMIQQKAMAEIGQFSMTIAHEIKNPLGIIKGAIDILKQENTSDETKDIMTGYIEDEVLRLDRLIQNFLFFAKPKKLRFEPVDMSELMHDTVKRMELEWNVKGIEFELDIEDGILCSIDREMFGMAIVNLLKNACEACGEQGDVVVTLKDIGGRCLISISDSGNGVPEKDRDKIFEPFFTTKSKGTGLGLAFVKRIIEGHNGNIDLVESKDKGATFEIRMQTFG